MLRISHSFLTRHFRSALVSPGFCHKTESGELHFRGLVATVDGSQIMHVVKTGPFTEADAVRIGKEAGAHLKATGPKELFMY